MTTDVILDNGNDRPPPMLAQPVRFMPFAPLIAKRAMASTAAPDRNDCTRSQSMRLFLIVSLFMFLAWDGLRTSATTRTRFPARSAISATNLVCGNATHTRAAHILRDQQGFQGDPDGDSGVAHRPGRAAIRQWARRCARQIVCMGLRGDRGRALKDKDPGDQDWEAKHRPGQAIRLRRRTVA